jgi:glutamate-5-semialdehyde dehydrogenase
MAEQAATEQQVHDSARRARDAAAELAQLSRGQKDAALYAMADALEEATDAIVAANARDVAAGREAGLSDGLVDRLTLTADRVAGAI